MLSNQWVIKDFYPIDYLPRGVRLSAYGGDASDLPADALQRYLDAIAAGEAHLEPVTTYALEEVPEAHADIEANRVLGKVVGLTAD